MTIATTRPSRWQTEVEELDPPLRDLPVSAVPGAGAHGTSSYDDEVLESILRGHRKTPGDPEAARRWAERLHDVTGWEFPEIPTDREYVSRLWAEDWDSPEDSVYDDM